MTSVILTSKEIQAANQRLRRECDTREKALAYLRKIGAVINKDGKTIRVKPQ